MWLQRWAKALREPPGNPRPILVIYGVLVLASFADTDPLTGLMFWLAIGLIIEWTVRVEKKQDQGDDSQ